MQEILTYGTTLIGIAAFVFSVLQYLDVRRREDRTRRFEQFHRVFEWVAGRTAEGKPLVDTQQAIAIYELSEFPEYRHMVIPILNYYLGTIKDEPDDTLFKRALLDTLARFPK